MVSKKTANGIALIVAGIAAAKIGAESATTSYASSSSWVPSLAIVIGVIYLVLGLVSKTNVKHVEREERGTVKKEGSLLKNLFNRDN